MTSFDEVFKPERKWQDKRLSGNSPCNSCDTYKAYERKALYGTIAERPYAALPKSCNTCIPKLRWQMDCMSKLKWYEDHDERLPNHIADVSKKEYDQ